MPAGKKGKQRKNSDDSNNDQEQGPEKDVPIDVQYNPEVIGSIIIDLKKEVDSKCSQIQRDVDFMSLSLQQAFNLELIKLPTHVKQMPLSRFKEEFGDSLINAVSRGALHPPPSQTSAVKPHNSHTVFASATKLATNNVIPFETPSSKQTVRMPKEGETILSVNGSPLGEFQTVVKAPKSDHSIIPPTPGAILLDSGAIVDVETVDGLDPAVKQEALGKVQNMMETMQLMMEKLSKK